MGCFQSKQNNEHSNVFRVVNIDEHGMELWTGKLEVTENDLVLYREGRDTTVWPLHSLRRYGYEGEIFSFESGRRCETGEGIYAFRCRRAPTLFSTLQYQIQLRNESEGATYQPSTVSPTSMSRQILQASVVHRSSIDHGQPSGTRLIHNNNLSNSATQANPRPDTQNPTSVMSADILEVMPLYPRPQTSNHATNVYQVSGFKREHNNNHSDAQHVYSNDLSRDLAMLRNTLREECAINTMRDIEDETRFLKGRYINENCIKENTETLSPTLSNSSEHYAQLSIEQQQATFRMYMNIAPLDKRANAAATEYNKNETPSASGVPNTPKLVEYCNLSIGVRPEVNTYANLSLGDMADSIKNAKQIFHSTYRENGKESDTYKPMSPVEETGVNYAILDIDANTEPGKMSDLVSIENQPYNSYKIESNVSHSHGRARLISQPSVEKSSTVSSAAAIGYTTIDFDKTVALTSVAADNIDSDGTRTRHNSSNFTCISPSDKVKT